MSRKKISGLTSGTTATGGELIEAVQSGSKKLTVRQILGSTSGISTAGGVSTSNYLEVGSGATIAGTLKIRIGGTTYYIMLSSAEAN